MTADQRTARGSGADRQCSRDVAPHHALDPALYTGANNEPIAPACPSALRREPGRRMVPERDGGHRPLRTHNGRVTFQMIDVPPAAGPVECRPPVEPLAIKDSVCRSFAPRAFRALRSEPALRRAARKG